MTYKDSKFNSLLVCENVTFRGTDPRRDRRKIKQKNRPKMAVFLLLFDGFSPKKLVCKKVTLRGSVSLNEPAIMQLISLLHKPKYYTLVNRSFVSYLLTRTNYKLETAAHRENASLFLIYGIQFDNTFTTRSGFTGSFVLR